MTEVYGVVRGATSENDPTQTWYQLPFEVTRIEKDATARPPGKCHVTIVFRPKLNVPDLGLSTEQMLTWGLTAPSEATLPDLLPFETREYHGFYERKRLSDGTTTEALAGHGGFFSSPEEADKYAGSIYGAKVVDLLSRP